MDAEYNAAAEAAKEAVWIRNFINDLRIPQVQINTVPLYIGNNSPLKLTRNPEFHSRSKHIDVKHHFVREKVEEGVINTQRINTRDNLADILTKALPRPTHENVVHRLNLSSGGDAEEPDCIMAATMEANRKSGSMIYTKEGGIMGSFESATALRSVAQGES